MFGNACTPVVDSCQSMAKPIQYCKVKKEKKRKRKVIMKYNLQSTTFIRVLFALLSMCDISHLAFCYTVSSGNP